MFFVSSDGTKQIMLGSTAKNLYSFLTDVEDNDVICVYTNGEMNKTLHFLNLSSMYNKKEILHCIAQICNLETKQVKIPV